MAKKVSVTNLEQEALRHYQERGESLGFAGKYASALAGLLRKLDEPARRREGLSLPDAEMALGGCRKYAPFRGGNRHLLEGRLRAMVVKQGEMEAVGTWADHQQWLKEITMASILNNWTDWLSRAAAWYRREGLMMPVWAVTAGPDAT